MQHLRHILDENEIYFIVAVKKTMENMYKFSTLNKKLNRSTHAQSTFTQLPCVRSFKIKCKGHLRKR